MILLSKNKTQLENCILQKHSKSNCMYQLIKIMYKLIKWKGQIFLLNNSSSSAVLTSLLFYRKLRHSNGIALENQEKYDFLKATLPADDTTIKHYWTSGSDINSENKFVWEFGNGADMPGFSFANWLPGIDKFIYIDFNPWSSD